MVRHHPDLLALPVTNGEDDGIAGSAYGVWTDLRPERHHLLMNSA